ncbi:CG34289 [Drosophila busckii]|uniref:CG34289 n=1 Tax=Drosophila busckii TaxID=30019 RepID=A0A0M4EJ94_DROBS|nr:uncharacterized protein LOC108602665 [Drosophila busckii]ALC46934.1 CG34289 [Drosophila busckii]
MQPPTSSSPCIFCLEEQQQQPTRLPCRHSFCRLCLERYLQLSRDRRCPLCRRGFQLSADAAAVAVPDRTVLADEHVLDLDRDMLNDTLVLTLSEQEMRFFAELYDEATRSNRQRATSTDKRSLAGS